MVIEFTSDVLEYVYKIKLDEFKCLAYLIKNNIGDSIFGFNYQKNFVYLNFDACNFLMEKFEDSIEFSKYNDNLQNILSSVENFERIKIVPPNSSNNKFEIEYNLEKVKRLLNDIPEIIIENINDEPIYESIIKIEEENIGLKKKSNYVYGNGGQVEYTTENKIKKEQICIVITDRDEKYFGENNLRSTPNKLKALFEQNNILGQHIIISYKNIEGLIPYRYVLNNLKNKKRNAFDKLYKIRKNKKWLNYFDFKAGLKKNLKSNGKLISESKQWWDTCFYWEENQDILSFLTNVSSLNDEILVSGIPKYNFDNIPYEEFLNNSSKEQRQEYERIGKSIYPWIVVNDYVVE